MWLLELFPRALGLLVFGCRTGGFEGNVHRVRELFKNNEHGSMHSAPC